MTSNELPPGWATASLGALASTEPRSITDGPFGSDLKTAHYTDDGPRVIRLQNIGEMRFIDDRAHISEEHFERLQSHSVHRNDLLIAGLGEQLPRACLAPSSLGPAIVKADCFRVRPHPEIVPEYLCAVLNSPQVRSSASSKISGVGRPRLNLQKVRSIQLPVPPRAEQEEIVAALDEHFSRLGAGLAAIESLYKNLGRMRAAVLLAAFSSIAADSQMIRGEKLFSFVTSGSRGWASYYSDEGSLFLRVGNLPRYGIDLDLTAIQHVKAPSTTEGVRTRLAPGDVLISITADLGRVAVTPAELGEAYINQHVALARPTSDVNSKYLAWYLASPLGRKQWGTMRRGATKVGLGLDDIRAVQIPVPDDAVQVATVDQIERAWSTLEAIEASVMTAEQRAKRLRSSLLAAAYSGALVEQNPQHEPASSLLQRIANDRASSAASGAARGRSRVREIR